MSLRIVVSPYHLTSREPPAMASLLLADEVVTVLPVPASDEPRAQAETLAAAAPRYARLMEEWRWSVPLWNEGVLFAEVDGTSPAGDIHAAHAEILASTSWASLRALLEERQHESESSYLQALAHDMLRGGPDPALTIPVAVGIDRFAARNGLVVARAAATSVAQKLEAQSARAICSTTLPIIMQGRADRILEARTALEDELNDLRDAVLAAQSGAVDGLREASRRYRAAFESDRNAFAEHDADEMRLVTGEASLRLVEMSSEAALASSERATRVLTGSRKPPAVPGLIAVAGQTCSMIVRALGVH